jgi:type IV secretory pathway VirB2 component (pilin)
MRRHLAAVVAGSAAAGVAPAAWASTTSGLAVDTWLHNTLTSYAGPVAYAAVLVGVIVAGARLAAGGDLYGFLRTLAMLTIIAGLTLGGQTVIGMMSANAAVVAAPNASSAQAAGLQHHERST